MNNTKNRESISCELQKYVNFVNWSQVGRHAGGTPYTLNPRQGKIPSHHRELTIRLLQAIKKVIDGQKTPDQTRNPKPGGRGVGR